MSEPAPIKYQDLIATMFEGTPSRDDKVTSSQKKKLIQDIDRLDKKDHIGILKIIKNQIAGQKKKIYTINNYGCYFDLNDLDNVCINEIRYYVNLCLQNLERKQQQDEIYKEHEEHNRIMEERFKNNKFKLGPIKPISVHATLEEEEAEAEEEAMKEEEETISSDLENGNGKDSDDDEDEDDMMMQGGGIDLEDTTISDC